MTEHGPDDYEYWLERRRKREWISTAGWYVLFAFIVVVTLAIGIVCSALEWRLNEWLWS